MTARGGRPPELEPRQLGLEERQAVDGDVPVLVGEQHRLVEPLGLGADVQPAGGQQLGEGAQPAGGVVVARRQHDGRAGAAQPGRRPGSSTAVASAEGTARS